MTMRHCDNCGCEINDSKILCLTFSENEVELLEMASRQRKRTPEEVADLIEEAYRRWQEKEKRNDNGI